MLSYASVTATVKTDQTTAYYSIFDSPLGSLWVAATKKGVCALTYACPEEEFVERLAKRGLRGVRSPEELQPFVTELKEYFTGQRTEFGVPLDLTGMGDFQRDVLLSVQSVPGGETVSYGELAHRIGHPGAARAVGNALATNPIPVLLPCHRVVRKDGAIGEYALRTLDSVDGRAMKRALLKIEGWVN